MASAPQDKPHVEEATTEEAKQVGLKIFKYCDTKDKALLIIGGFCAFASGAGMSAFSQVNGMILGDMTDPNVDLKAKMSTMALVMFITGCAMAVPASISGYCLNFSTMRQSTRIKLLYFTALMRQEVAWHDANPPGELTSRMDGDVRVIEDAMGSNFQQILQHFGTIGFAYGIAFYNSWQLALLTLGALPFIAVNSIFFAHRIKKASLEARNGYAKAGGLALEAIDNIKTVQVFGQEAYESERFSKAVAPAMQSGIRKETSSYLITGFNNLFLYIAVSMTFWFGAYLISWGTLSIDNVYTVMMSGIMSGVSVTRVSPCLSTFLEGASAAAKIFAVIDRTPTMDIVSVATEEASQLPQDHSPSSPAPAAVGRLLPGKRLQNEINFKDVVFSYPTRSEDKLFTKLNVTIKKGQTVAFSGSSGCGKSSIIGLLQRYYDPLDGTITVDGIDLRDLNLRAWRDCISIVSQEPKLFTGTVMDNVRVAKQDATDEEVIAACKKAHVHQVIEKLPDQYHTLVGTGGAQLSGGQKQRVAIARALIRNPQILILDEATSALDRKSEVEVQAALEDVMFGSRKAVDSEHSDPLTVIVIAHRLATIRNADVIHYIDRDQAQGSWIEESGSYDELMEMNGHFAAMTKKQHVEKPTTANESAASPTAEESSEAEIAFPQEVKAVDLLGSETGDAAAKQLGDDEAAKKDMDTDEADAELYKDLKEKGLKERDAEGIKATPPGHGRILQMFAEDKWLVFIGILGCVLVGGEYPVYAIIFGYLLEVLGLMTYTKDESLLTTRVPTWCGSLLAVAVGSWLAHWMMCGFAYSGERLTLKLRRALFYSILRQDMTFFDTPGRDSSSLATILSTDTQIVYGLWGPSIGSNLRTVTTLIVGLVVAFIYAWRVAFVTLATIPIFAIAIGGTAALLKAFGGEDDNAFKAEALTNIRTVISLNLQDYMIARYTTHVTKLSAKHHFNAVIKGIQAGLINVVMFGGTSIIIWYQGKLIAEGVNTFAQCMIAQQSVFQGLRGIGDSAATSAKFRDAGGAASRVFYIIDRIPAIEAAPKADLAVVYGDDGINKNGLAREAKRSAAPDDLQAVSGSRRQNKYADLDSIDLSDIRFRYPARPEAPLLRGVDLSFSMPKTYGLMGETGCGKSTLIGLLTRLYDPAAGSLTVTVCGEKTPLKDLKLDEWRANISLVLQEPSLFSGTIRENIRYSNPSATDEEIVQAARYAAIHDDILLMPNGYDTEVGYKGQALSGGQKQRVAIARALVRKPRMLLMDEATSALDNATESRVEQGLKEACEANEMIVVSVAHRLTTIRDSDKIAVMEAGRVKEFGSHDELVALGGHYKDRWELFEAAAVRQKSAVVI